MERGDGNDSKKPKNSKQNKQKNPQNKWRKAISRRIIMGKMEKKNNIHAVNFSLEDVDVKLT